MKDEFLKRTFDKGAAYRLNRIVADFYRSELLKSGEAHIYLCPPEVAQSFEVGVSPASTDGLLNFLEPKGLVRLATDLGLIAGTGRFDAFRSRFMLPIHDLDGGIVGFAGFSSPDTSADAPHCLNSPDSFIFDKSKILYGLYQAKDHIREKEEAIVVKGYIDVLAMHVKGVKNVVSTCGNVLTTSHIHLLDRFCSKITLASEQDPFAALDSD